MKYDNSGFTLVELAVVMVIIGLLLGGVLKGQEMISNARVTSTVAQIKAIDAAQNTFFDIYDALPGDMLAANTRISGVVNSGDGNRRINNWPLGTASTEAQFFFEHLEGAGLVSGVNLTTGYMDGSVSGTEIRAGTFPGGALQQNPNASSGLYVTIVPKGANIGPALTANEAARIDRKVDDGRANSGAASVDNGACHSSGTYNEDRQGALCSLAIHIGG